MGLTYQGATDRIAGAGKNTSEKTMTGLFYITHMDNVPSILENGILSHANVVERDIDFTPIYDKAIVETRSYLETSAGISLNQYANLYFQPRNPMLFKLAIGQRCRDNIAVLGIKPNVLNKKGIFIADGNAASDFSTIYPREKGLKNIDRIRRQVRREYWTSSLASKRKIMAEVLVPECIEPDYIDTFYVANHDTKSHIESLIGTRIPGVVDPHMFFLSNIKTRVNSFISLAEGDMFFSEKQTLTISVNCVGVMGKGLASRARYQFPDVYVRYEDACRDDSLKMGKPFLYQREDSVIHELSDEPSTLEAPNEVTWFLLFATKNHWRNNADIAGIQEGLQWIMKTYKRNGIKSLALPALGCGLGRLRWEDVGPLMCQTLRDIDIDTWIYLPAEHPIPEEFTSREFLLSL